MAMRITKHDIGAEIISILTRGMYPDPRDALREYVQNGVDAGAKHIGIKIRSNTIAIMDDGEGMDENVMRDAIRVGISDKNPHAEVGFRGIGIYSAFHLCDELRIYSRTEKDDTPRVLLFNFKSMRDLLEKQQLDRVNGTITAKELVDLQAILQDNIRLRALRANDFVQQGTRVEMFGLEPSFFQSLSRFEEVADYLRQVVPLHFDPDHFKWAKRIEKKIRDTCAQHGTRLNLVSLKLQVNKKTESLFRPYRDDLFGGDPLRPVFREVKSRHEFFGVVWGCLNPVRKKIQDRHLRGFLLTKQGFALGRRTDMARHFGKRTTYFDRYIGEIIVVEPGLLPNAARTDFEHSAMRTSFYEALASVAAGYNEKADEHQELTKGDDVLDAAIDRITEIEKTIAFNYEKADRLLDMVVEIRSTREELDKRLKKGAFRSTRTDDAKSVSKSARAMERQIQDFIESSKKKRRKKASQSSPEDNVRKRLRKLPRPVRTHARVREPESLIDVLEAVDLALPEEAKAAMELLDERFIQSSASSKAEYTQILKELQEELEDIVLEGA